jgi:two-component system response regulator YesN
MLKAVIFDDEYIVLEALSALVDWEGLGIRLAGAAGDGISALETFRNVRPDIVLTDIRMPGKDGLQLLEEILEEAPDTCCIVFSGFNEFEYVKRAIRLGVADYVEKPFTEHGIEQALRKALRQIRKKEAVKDLERKWDASRRELLDKAVWDLLLHGREALAKWRETFGQEERHVQAVTVMAAAGDFALPDHPAYRTVDLRIEGKKVAVVFHFMELSHAYWDEIASDLDSAGTAVGIGRTYPNPEEAPRSYQEALHALKYALLLEAKGAMKFGELGASRLSPEGWPDREEAIVLSMRTGNKAMLMDEVDRFIGWIHASKVDPDVAEREMLKLIYIAMDAAKGNAAGTGSLFPPNEPYMPHIEIRKASSAGALSEWFREQMALLADKGLDARERIKHAAVEKACRFIERNVTRDVSLQETAEHVGLNATYLSVLFKEVMGETYIKYLTRIRMEMAKTLLNKGCKVSEVGAKVGYLTNRHFTEVFKKYTGKTPGQFKDGSI